MAIPKAATKPAAKKAATKISSASKPAGSAFMKPMAISATLASVIGPAPTPRTEVTKKIWDYI